jgi:small ligand-binding sensory domain FIST
VFARPRGFGPPALEPLAGLRFGAIAGGGTTGDDRVLSLAPGRAPKLADAGALVLRGLTPPVVRVSPACRLLTPLAPITATRGPQVLEIAGQRALEVLSASAQNLSGQPLVLAALAAGEPPALLVRAIQGVDPTRQGVHISEEVRPGMRIAFAVRDAAAARADLEATTLRLLRDTAGAAPRFLLYMSCAGRGSSLYGTPDVDVRILKSRFPDVPIAGMHSSFELASHEGAPALELYCGVLALSTLPS